MSDTQYIIYSKSRESTQPTLAYLRMAGVLARTHILVPDDQVSRYKSAGLSGVVGAPSEYWGSHGSRRYAIAVLAPRLGADRIILLDDDLTLYYRPNPDDWHLQYIRERDQMLALLDWYDVCFAEGLAHCGISMRGGNNRVQEHWVDNTRSMAVYGYDAGVINREVSAGRITLGRCPGMDDFDLTLQLLRLGYPNRVSYVFAQGQKSSNSPGGCSTWRTPEVLAATARELADHHPGLVRVKEKASRNWEGFPETRTDVTVSWQKAFASSQRERV